MFITLAINNTTPIVMIMPCIELNRPYIEFKNWLCASGNIHGPIQNLHKIKFSIWNFEVLYF